MRAMSIWNGAPGRSRLRPAALAASSLAGAAVLVAALVSHGDASGQGTAAGPQSVALSGSGATVGPGPVVSVLASHGYRPTLRLTPNRATHPDDVSVDLDRAGRPVDGAHVRRTFRMLDMDMGQLSGSLPQRAQGHYERPAPIPGMNGRWAVRLDINPPGGAPFRLSLTDQMNP